MKKLLCLVLVTMLAAACCAPAMAVNADLSSEDGDYFYVRGMTAVGDMLWVTEDTGEGFVLARMDPTNLNEPLARYTALADERILNGENYSWIEENEEEGEPDGSGGPGLAPALHVLFAMDGKLCGADLMKGLIYTVDETDKGLAFNELVKIGDVSELVINESDYYSLPEFHGVFAQDGWLYLCCASWMMDGTQMQKFLRISLTDGTVEKIDIEKPYVACAYKDGKVALTTWDAEHSYDEAAGAIIPQTLSLYDPQTGDLTKVLEMDSSEFQEMAYSEAVDGIVYLKGTRVMAVTDGLTQCRQVGYITMNGANSMALLENGKSVACSNYGGLTIREISAEYSAADSLNIYGSWMGDGDKLFAERHPDVPLYYDNNWYTSAEDIARAMSSGDDAVDILEMGVSWSSFTTLMNRGYCLSLDSYPELAEQVRKTYPAFADAVSANGSVYAVPLDAYGNGWFYSPSVLKEIGIDESELPTNMVELCEFVTRWNDELMDEAQDYTLFENGDVSIRETVLQQIMREYVFWLQSQGRDIVFDTPEFREVMAAFEDMECDDIDERNRTLRDDSGEEWFYQEGLIQIGYQTVGYFYWMGADSEDDWQRYLPMSLTADTEPVHGAQLTVAFINPKSPHADYAAELLACKLEKLDPSYRATLFSDQTKAVENPDYEREIEESENRLTELKNELAETTDEDAKQALQEELDWFEPMVEEQRESLRYTISQTQIDYYIQNVVPSTFVIQPSFVSGQDNTMGEMTTLINRYKDGQMSLDQFIREADNKMMLIRMENQ